MKNFKLSFFIALGLLIIYALLLLFKHGAKPKNNLNVLVTTFPIYQITKNVAKGRKGVNVDLMLPSSLGCPHDYTLTPRDMHKLETADVLVVNGFGLEEFLGAPTKKANPKIKLIDSSTGIKDLLKYTEQEEGTGSYNGSDHHHHNSVINPHLFASPRMSAKISMNIMEGLSQVDPEGKDIYLKNAKAYAGKLSLLADKMAVVGKGLKNNGIVTQHGIFDYLTRDLGMNIVSVIQSHGGKDPSASEMLEIIKEIKDKKVVLIFSEPQYSDRLARTISAETGVPIAELDPVATGPIDSPLDYYETKMKENLIILKKALGEK